MKERLTKQIKIRNLDYRYIKEKQYIIIGTYIYVLLTTYYFISIFCSKVFCFLFPEFLERPRLHVHEATSLPAGAWHWAWWPGPLKRRCKRMWLGTVRADQFFFCFGGGAHQWADQVFWVDNHSTNGGLLTYNLSMNTS